MAHTNSTYIVSHIIILILVKQVVNIATILVCAKPVVGMILHWAIIIGMNNMFVQ